MTQDANSREMGPDNCDEIFLAPVQLKLMSYSVSIAESFIRDPVEILLHLFTVFAGLVQRLIDQPS